MAPGTRSRRADVLHRTPVLLPKPRQRQTTLDQHLHQARQQATSTTTTATSTRPPPPPHPSRQPKPLQRQQQRPLSQHSQQQTPPYAIAAPTRSIQDILNHASSMSTARPKRKATADADADAKVDGKDAKGEARRGKNTAGGISDTTPTVGSGSDIEAAVRKRPRLAVEIVDYAKLQSQQQQHKQLPVASVSHTALPNPARHANATTKLRANESTPTTPASTSQQRPLAAHPPTTTTSNIPSTTLYSPVARQQPPTDSNRTTRRFSSNTTAASQPRPTGRLPSKTAPQSASIPKEKAANGFKQELKSLHVTPADAVAVASAPREGGRKLRSQEATRFKSELSAYFPDYDEVIGNEPKEEHILNADTPILLVESSTAYPALPHNFVAPTPLPASLRSHDCTSPVPVKGYGDKLFYDVFDSHVLDFTFLGTQHKNKGAIDPLPNSLFEAHHKRAERLERSIRNTEKGRAQHEKDQIIRLLDGLQGPDWLRTMGVSGITESKKKTFEPARDHFIRGCRIILEKFRLWSLEEKRRKLEKDRAHAEEVKARESAAIVASEPGALEHRGKGKAKADNAVPKSRKRRDASSKEATGRGRTRVKNTQDETATADEDAEGGDEGEGVETEAGTAEDEDEDEDEMDDDSQPDSSDFDAVIARQLREEALARSMLASKSNAASSSSSKGRKPRRSSSTSKSVATTRLKDPSSPSHLPPSTLPPKEEVKSFFRKRYQRDAALSRSRRKGRTVMAWGQPVPEPSETEFNLPGDILDDDVEPKAVGRRKRGGARGGHK